MSCYKDGGCGIYEMYSCYECPASKPEYLKRKSHEPQKLQAIGNLHDVAKQILDDEVRKCPLKVLNGFQRAIFF